jgi:hypothetical protein
VACINGLQGKPGFPQKITNKKYIILLQFARGTIYLIRESIWVSETAPLRLCMCSPYIWGCLVKKSMTLLLPIELNAREASEHLASLDKKKYWTIAHQHWAKLSELNCEWSWRTKKREDSLDLASHQSQHIKSKTSLTEIIWIVESHCVVVLWWLAS